MTRLAMAAMIAAALMVGGCSSESAPSKPSVTDTPSTAHGSLADCLRDHGIDEPATAVLGPPAGVDQAIWDQAMSMCSTLAPGPGGS
jgi:hypothetical protein